MTDRSTLLRRPGALSGRIRPTGWLVPEGSWAYALGLDEPGYTGRFKHGDAVRVRQSGGDATARLIRSRARLRGPLEDLPAGWFWIVYAEADGIEAWEFVLEPGRTRDLRDLAICTRDVGGFVDLAFTLAAVGPSADAIAELEIPVAYLDAHSLDADVAGLVIANRSPEPDAIGVARDVGLVQFDIIDPLASSPDPDATQVWIDGVLAWDGASGAQPGYPTVVSTPMTGVLRFAITVSYEFESERLIPIRVRTANLAADLTLDETWTFEIVDETPPRVLGAIAQDHMTVRVTWSEPVLQEDPAGDSDALNPARYSFSALDAPAVPIVAVSVASVAPTVVDVTVDIPMTRSARYEVRAPDVADLLGNLSEAPYERATFSGFQCDVPEDREFEHWEFLPELNRGEDATGELFAFSSVLQEVIDLLLCDVDRWTEILDVDVAAERYLDQMLIECGNPFAFTLSVDDKRRLIRVLTQIYQLKGTSRGVIDVVRFFLGLEVTIDAYNVRSVWILGDEDLGLLGDTTILGSSRPRDLYSFDVVSPVALSEEERDRIRTIAEYMKPAHTHLIRIREPEAIETIDHLELGLSELADEWLLH